MDQENKKEPCGGTASNQIEIYAAEKRMSLVLKEKFEMQEELHTLLCGEQKETIEAYTDIFDVMDCAIIQEAKIIERHKKAIYEQNHLINSLRRERSLSETDADKIARKILLELHNRDMANSIVKEKKNGEDDGSFD